MRRLVALAGMAVGIAAGQPVSRITAAWNVPSREYVFGNPMIAFGGDGSTYIAGTGAIIVEKPINQGGGSETLYPVLQKVNRDGSVAYTKRLAAGIATAVAVSASGDVLLGVKAVYGPVGWVMQFGPDGTEGWTVGVGGEPDALAADSSGAVYVAGVAGTGLPATAGSFQPTSNNANCPIGQPARCSNAFAAKIKPDGSGVSWATYLGGSGNDAATAVAVDETGSVFVAGNAMSGDFPTTSAAGGGAGDVFVAKLSADGSALVYSVVIGGTGTDTAAAITLDGNGAVYVAGKTASSDFPVSDGAYQSSYGGGASDGFVLKLDVDGNIVFSTYLGSSGDDQAASLALNADGRLYVAVLSTVLAWPTPAAGSVAGMYLIQMTPYPISGPFYAVMAGRSPEPCDPPNTLVAMDASTGMVSDFERLTGLLLETASVGNGGTGVALVFGFGDPATARYVGANDSENVLLQVDFSKSDLFLLSGVANYASGSRALPTVNTVYGNTTAALGAGEIIRIQGVGLGPSAAIEPPFGSPPPFQIGDTQVLLDGVPLGLIYASDSEIDAVIPYSEESGNLVTMTIQNGDFQVSYPFVSWSRSPGLVTRDGSGRGLAAAVNEDGTINSEENPARAGSVVSLFATGLGQFNPPIPDNSPGPITTALPTVATPVRFTIQSSAAAVVDMPVLYAGPAPGEVPGKYQLNVQIPGSVPPGLTLFEMVREWGGGAGYSQGVLSLWVK